MPVIVRTNKKTGAVHSAFECKCGKRSKWFLKETAQSDRDKQLAAIGWIGKWEAMLTPTGRLKKRGGHTMRYLCKPCQKKAKSNVH